jgi:hypothetical protein
MAKPLCSFSQTENCAISNQEQPVLTHSCIKVTYCFPSAEMAWFDAFGKERVSNSFLPPPGNCLKSAISAPSLELVPRKGAEKKNNS